MDIDTELITSWHYRLTNIIKYNSSDVLLFLTARYTQTRFKIRPTPVYLQMGPPLQVVQFINDDEVNDFFIGTRVVGTSLHVRDCEEWNVGQNIYRTELKRLLCHNNTPGHPITLPHNASATRYATFTKVCKHLNCIAHPLFGDS